ncbi:PIR Superfamily Protein [Plasmodium ovale curtisi]|uniref:PIR Superfamily Protein n=1 Tax=Plasmodium ovale curtisi TaxID=864141 RepID=A0A1A8X149_PLAOA|nr:PIR Superfamily Protein [Plasmodium ovale curtisi]
MEEDTTFFNSELPLKENLYNVDIDLMDNMKISFNLYNIKKTINGMFITQYSNFTCTIIIEKIKKCGEIYKESIVSSRNDCEAFHDEYEKFFSEFDRFMDKSQYNESIELPDCYSVLGKYKKGKIINITLSSILVPKCVLLFALLFFNRFITFREFIPNKTKMFKNMWTNVNGGKELLNSYDIKNGNSDIVEYIIGYSFASNSYSFYIRDKHYL